MEDNKDKKNNQNPQSASDKDRTGNSVSYSKVGGFSSHSEQERETNDYYATEPKAIEWLLKLEGFNNRIREPACGEGHLSKYLVDQGYDVYSSDLIDRGYGKVRDFLETSFDKDLTPYSDLLGRDIITNPPYKIAGKFILHGLNLLEVGGKLALFLPIRYLEGKDRKKIFQAYPPQTVWVSSSRLKCAMNGEFDKMNGSAVCYAWFIRERGHQGNTTLKWFN